MLVSRLRRHRASNRKKIVDRLIDEVRRDRAKVSVSSRLSEFGLLEMTRQRVRPNLLHDHSDPCPVCSGTGRVMGPDTTMTKIERWLQRSFAATRERRYVLKVHPDVATTESLLGLLCLFFELVSS